MNLDTITFTWLLMVASIGAVLGLLRRRIAEHPVPFGERVRQFIIGFMTSMFTAYITYELVFGYLNKVGVAVAVAGLAAWMGADALIALEAFVKNYLKKRGE